MNSQELIQLLKSEKDFFTGLTDLKEIVLYGSALVESEIASDIDLLAIPARELSGLEGVELRQSIWEHLKGHVPVALDVQTPRVGLDKEALSSTGVEMTSVFSR